MRRTRTSCPSAEPWRSSLTILSTATGSLNVLSFSFTPSLETRYLIWWVKVKSDGLCDVVRLIGSVSVKPKSLEHYLSLEEPRLLNHLKSIGSWSQLPYGLWFRRCFAGCLPESSLQRFVRRGTCLMSAAPVVAVVTTGFCFWRVWDKVISGSCKILVFVALEILLSYKIMLLGISRPEGVVKFLCNVSQLILSQRHISTLMHVMSFSCRSRRRTPTASWPKPSTCGTNTVAHRSTLCSRWEQTRWEPLRLHDSSSDWSVPMVTTLPQCGAETRTRMDK